MRTKDAVVAGHEGEQWLTNTRLRLINTGHRPRIAA